MQVTPNQFVPAFDVLKAVSTQSIPGRLALSLHKTMADLAVYVAAYHQSRLALCERYGTKVEAENRYTFTDENKPLFEQEFNDLLNTTIEVNVSLSEAVLDHITLSAQQAATIAFLFP